MLQERIAPQGKVKKHYQVVLARHQDDVRAAQRLRWQVFADEMGASLSPQEPGLDIDLFDKYGSDAVRYWAAGGRPGVDTAFDEGQMKIGRKLATKLLNATKFVLSFGEPPAHATATAAVDLAMLASLDTVVADATEIGRAHV